jgi:hypothetical protein
MTTVPYLGGTDLLLAILAVEMGDGIQEQDGHSRI